MKKVLLIIFIVLLFVCVAFLFKNDSSAPQVVDGISIIIKEGTLTRSGASIIIVDTTLNEEHTYGESFRIEKKENDKWVSLDTIIDRYGFDDIGYNVNKDKKLEMNVNWEWLYGKLENGQYRLIKDYGINKNDSYLGNKEIYVEFIIGDNI